MGEMNYGVVIVNWNGAADTIACLKSIVMGGNCCRVIVIDNGSTDDSMTSIADEMRLYGLRCRALATDEQLESTESARILLIPTGEKSWVCGRMQSRPAHCSGDRLQRSGVS